MNRWFRIILAMLLVVCVIAPAFAGGAREREAIPFAIQHNASGAHPWQDGLQYIADEMERQFPGEFQIVIYHSGSLADQDWAVILEQTQTNVVQLSIESFPPMATIVPELFALSTPFLFEDMEHTLRFHAHPEAQQLVQSWLAKMEQRDLKTIAVWPRPPRQLLNSRRPIIVPADIQDLPFRVPALDLFVRTFEAMGANPIPMPSGEIYTAMQLGTVVGEDNSIGIVFDFKTYEQGRYFNVWNYMADGVLVNVNKEWFEGLSQQQREALEQAADEAAQVIYEKENALQERARAQMEAEGIEFTDFTAEMKEPWRRRMEQGGVYNMLRDVVGQRDWDRLVRLADATR